MRLSAVFFAVTAATALTGQSVPTTINYQGRLTDNSPQQNPVNATVAMAFAIWNDPTAGTNLWQEPASGGTSVLVTGGIFNVALGGNGVPLSASVFSGANSTRYLEITLNPGTPGQEVLTPRQLISASGYAARSQNASGADSAVNFSGPLAGDVTGAQGATVVASVGGHSAANVAAGTLLANGATSLNTPNTIPLRNGTGGFAMGALSATAVQAGPIPPGTDLFRVSNQIAGSPRVALITGNTSTSTAPIAEFRHDTLTQGVGIGYASIYATGSNTNQGLDISSRGNLPLTLNSAGTGNVSIGPVAADTRLTVASGANNPVRIGDTSCGSTFAGIGLFGPMSGCTNYAFVGNSQAATPDLFINRPTNGTMFFRQNNVTQASLDAAGTFHVGVTNFNGCDLTLGDDICFNDEQNGSLSVRNFANTAYAPVRASAFTVSSSRAFKRDIAPIDVTAQDDLRVRVEALPLYTFRFKSDGAAGKIHTGVVTEESPAAIVDADGTGVNLYDYLGVAVGALQSVSRESRDLAAKVDSLGAENARLRGENDALRARLERLEQAVDSLNAGK